MPNLQNATAHVGQRCVCVCMCAIRLTVLTHLQWVGNFRGQTKVPNYRRQAVVIHTYQHILKHTKYRHFQRDGYGYS